MKIKDIKSLEISARRIKQVYKQHYQLHLLLTSLTSAAFITNQFNFISVRRLQKLLLKGDRGHFIFI